MEKETANLKVIFEDQNLLAIDKPSGIAVYSKKENEQSLTKELTAINPLLKNAGKAPRYGLVHRLDKETSGIVLIAKNNTGLSFFQKQFKEKKVIKKYIALAVGAIKENEITIESLIARDAKKRTKQRAYPVILEKRGARTAETRIRVIKRLSDEKNAYTLIEAEPHTGRKHQIRVHLQYIGHPIVGDKIYSFKNQGAPKNLSRLFLHASFLEINLPSGEKKQFNSPFPQSLREIVAGLREIED